jgi:hypothetical protein
LALNPFMVTRPAVSRRQFVRSLGAGLGSVGLLGMLAEDASLAAGASVEPTRTSPATGGAASRPPSAPAGPLPAPHFPPRATANIVLFLPGGPSHIDTFDSKPALAKHAGERPAGADLRTERTTGGR